MKYEICYCDSLDSIKMTALFILTCIKYFVTFYNCYVYVLMSCRYVHWSCLNHALYFNICIQLFSSVQHRHRCMQQYKCNINASDDIFLLSTFYKFRAWNVFANTRRQNKIINAICPNKTDLIYEIEISCLLLCLTWGNNRML